MYRVLVVDDEAAERDGLQFLLEQLALPFQVSTAANGRDALRLYENASFDILITDIKMPFMDGLTLCARLREKYPELMIVIYSAYGDFEYAKQAIHVRVDDYILKPVVVDDFEKTIRRLYDKLEAKARFDAKRESLLAEYSEANLLQKEQILNSVLRMQENQVETPQKASDVSQSIAMAIRCIEEHYMNDIGLEWISSQVFLSPGYLSGLFKQETGKSISQYITLCRLQKAKDLLITTNMRIADISRQVGIGSSSYFCLLFRKFYGITAQQLREEAHHGQQ